LTRSQPKEPDDGLHGPSPAHGGTLLAGLG